MKGEQSVLWVPQWSRAQGAPRWAIFSNGRKKSIFIRKNQKKKLLERTSFESQELKLFSAFNGYHKLDTIKYKFYSLKHDLYKWGFNSQILEEDHLAMATPLSGKTWEEYG